MKQVKTAIIYNLRVENIKLERVSTDQMFWCRGRWKEKVSVFLNLVKFLWMASATHWKQLCKWLFLPGQNLGFKQPPAQFRLTNDSFLLTVLLATPEEETLQWVLLTTKRHRKSHTALYNLEPPEPFCKDTSENYRSQKQFYQEKSKELRQGTDRGL